jgi:hypothetical protein
VAGSWSELLIQCKAIAMLDCIAKAEADVEKCVADLVGK